MKGNIILLIISIKKSMIKLIRIVHLNNPLHDGNFKRITIGFGYH